MGLDLNKGYFLIIIYYLKIRSIGVSFPMNRVSETHRLGSEGLNVGRVFKVVAGIKLKGRLYSVRSSSFEASEFIEVLYAGMTELTPVHDSTPFRRFTTKIGYVTRNRKLCHFNRNLCQNRPETTEMEATPKATSRHTQPPLPLLPSGPGGVRSLALREDLRGHHSRMRLNAY